MPDEQLFHVQQVELVVPVEKILSRAGKKAICEECGEEIINEREIMLDGHTLCRACGMDSYYRTIVEISVPDS
jgi:formylmethanofuran dehydrogenase subunit E